MAVWGDISEDLFKTESLLICVYFEWRNGHVGLRIYSDGENACVYSKRSQACILDTLRQIYNHEISYGVPMNKHTCLQIIVFASLACSLTMANGQTTTSKDTEPGKSVVKKTERLGPDNTLSGGPVSGGTLPGGTLPGGPVSGGTVPGGTVPGGTVPGGTLPGGTLPGGPVPADTVPGGTRP
jgi:hypothetical protein